MALALALASEVQALMDEALVLALFLRFWS